ncbi:substrate-binding domain-containing protein [Microbacteriaceae bacterium VKM Ac-2854]|nr:substrate-binding domain-containing protein [Microbacteriaceae bacterium VKM Ac-2854]
MKLRTYAAIGALTIGLAAALSGCTSATGSDSGSVAAAELTADQQSCVDAVQSKVDAATAASDLLAPETGLDLASLSGDTVWFITVSMNQFSTDMADGVQAAVDAAGMKLVKYDGQGTANRFNEGIEQAVAQDAAGIILVGIDPAVVSSALAEAEAAGIPIQNTLNGDPDDEIPTGMYGNLTSDFTIDGATAVDWALVDGGCDVNMTVIYSSGVGVWQKMADGAKAEMEEACPDCTINLLDVDIAKVATDVGSQLQTALQKDPDTNYVYPVWDSAVPYVTPVLSAANSSAKIVSRDGLEANIEMIVAGDQDMTIAMPTTGWIGWIAFDSLARNILGDADPGYVIPTHIIDTANVGDGSAEEVWPNYVGYEDAFTEAWAK